VRSLSEVRNWKAVRRSLPSPRHDPRLLCNACNLALGCLKEDQASLVAALAYLGALPRDGPE
jgi:hypothetical protein